MRWARKTSSLTCAAAAALASGRAMLPAGPGGLQRVRDPPRGQPAALPFSRPAQAWERGPWSGPGSQGPGLLLHTPKWLFCVCTWVHPVARESQRPPRQVRLRVSLMSVLCGERRWGCGERRRGPPCSPPGKEKTSRGFSSVKLPHQPPTSHPKQNMGEF